MGDEKLFPERERVVLRVKEERELCGRVRGRERSNETSGQSIFLPSHCHDSLSCPVDDIIFYTLKAYHTS